MDVLIAVVEVQRSDIILFLLDGLLEISVELLLRVNATTSKSVICRKSTRTGGVAQRKASPHGLGQ